MLAVTVNDRPLPAAAIVRDGRALLPLRATAQALGARVWYDARTRRVVVTRGAQRFDLRPVIVGNRAYAPLRVAAESLGARVVYSQHVVAITDDTALPVALGTPASSFTTPLPVPSPNPEYGGEAFAAGNEFSFYTDNGRAFYPGQWMHFVLVAPPGGSATMHLCNLGYAYSLSNFGTPGRYEANIPVPANVMVPNCLVTAEYTSWNGRTTVVPVPLYIGLYTLRAVRTPTPAPRAPTPSPKPVRTPRPQPTLSPAPVRTHAPLPTPRPHPRRTP